MRKLMAMVLAVIMAAALCACGEEVSHDDILSEIASQNSEYNAKRETFLNSKVHGNAVSYIRETLAELLPGSELEMSLEPGSLIDSDLSEFVSFDEDTAVRQKFFAEADLYIKVNFWESGKDAQELCGELMNRGISGRLASDEYGRDVYRLNAATGEAKFESMPET